MAEPEAFTAEDLEIARQAAKATRAFARIYEVAEKALRVTADLVSRQGELVALDGVLKTRRGQVVEVEWQLQQLDATRQGEETSLRRVQERVAREAHEVAETADRLKGEWATELEAARQAHRAQLADLDGVYAERQATLEQALHDREAQGAATLAALEQRIEGIRTKAQALAATLTKG